MSNDVIGLYGTIGAISVIEAILRILAYVAFICLSFKGVQALNTIHKQELKIDNVL